jgi:hypothetical protein
MPPDQHFGAGEIMKIGVPRETFPENGASRSCRPQFLILRKRVSKSLWKRGRGSKPVIRTPTTLLQGETPVLSR